MQTGRPARHTLMSMRVWVGTGESGRRHFYSRGGTDTDTDTDDIDDDDGSGASRTPLTKTVMVPIQ